MSLQLVNIHNAPHDNRSDASGCYFLECYTRDMSTDDNKKRRKTDEELITIILPTINNGS